MLFFKRIRIIIQALWWKFRHKKDKKYYGLDTEVPTDYFQEGDWYGK